MDLQCLIYPTLARITSDLRIVMRRTHVETDNTGGLVGCHRNRNLWVKDTRPHSRKEHCRGRIAIPYDFGASGS
jgi:hypothetical protein